MAILEAYPAPSNPLETLTQWEILFSRYQWSGVDGTPGGTELQPTLDPASRAIKVAAGGAMIRGIRWGCDSPASTAIPAASGQDRVDRLVLRLDRTKSTAAEYVTLKVLTGTAGSNTPPAITQTENGIFDAYIARWTSAASGALTGLVDERSWMATDGMVPCFSYRRPSSGFGTLMGELDTAKFRVGLGAGNFITFAEDSGSVQLFAEGNWKTSFTNVGRRLNGWVRLRIALERTVNSLVVGNAGTDNGSPLVATIPASLRPEIVEYGDYYIAGGRHGQISVLADGGVYLSAWNENIPVGATLRATIVYPGA